MSMVGIHFVSLMYWMQRYYYRPRNFDRKKTNRYSRI